MTTAGLRTGCDVVDVARLSAVIDRRAGLLARVFTERELADARRGGVAPGSRVERDRLAARFAAKEATRKALGALRLPLRDIEVRSAPSGAPELWIHGERAALSCSLAHDGGIAMAVVVGLVAPDDRATRSPDRPAAEATEDAGHGADRGPTGRTDSGATDAPATW